MKTTIYFMLLTMLFACGPDLSPEGLKKDFKEKAHQYLMHKIETDKSGEVAAAEILNMYDLKNLTEKGMAEAELEVLAQDALKKMNYYRDLLEIDDQFNYESQVTKVAEIDYEKAFKKAEDFKKQVDTKDDVLQIGYVVTASVDVIKADGSKIKDIPMKFYFDMDRFLISRIMDLIYE